MFKEKRQTYLMRQELQHTDLSELQLDQDYEGIK